MLFVKSKLPDGCEDVLQVSGVWEQVWPNYIPSYIQEMQPGSDLGINYNKSFLTRTRQAGQDLSSRRMTPLDRT